MAVKPVVKIGSKVLLTPSEAVTTITPELRQTLIQDMLDTMKAEDGAGLAAPQIGVNLRVMIFGVEKNPRYPDAEEVPLTILINPSFTALSDEKEKAWEGCLSIPGYRGVVSRYKEIEYRGFDENGQEIVKQVSDFHARVFQHEYDHLDGILYLHRIEDMRYFGLIEELQNSGMIPKPEEE